MLEVKKYLEDHGIKPSAQRLAIMEYLLTHRTHPTAEQIYSDLVATYPTLSKTTVYNTLNLFAENGAVLSLNLKGTMANFDGDVTPHAHFLCTQCGMIYDLDINFNSLACNPEGFKVDEVQVYYKGICKNCLKKVK